MTNNKKSTRYYSSRQEKKIAKAVGGRTVANSGAITFGAGDITSDKWLFEAKTKMEESKSFSIKREWIDKNKEEAFSMGKDYNALVIDFGDGKQFYLIDEKTFLRMKTLLEEDDEREE